MLSSSPTPAPMLPFWVSETPQSFLPLGFCTCSSLCLDSLSLYKLHGISNLIYLVYLYTLGALGSAWQGSTFLLDE